MPHAGVRLLALALLTTACDTRAPEAVPTAATVAQTLTAASTTTGDTIPGEYLVFFRERPVAFTALSARSQSTEIAAAAGVDSVANVYSSALRGFHAKGVTSDDLIRLLSDPRVARVVPNMRVHALVTAPPLEKQFDPPWGLDRIDQRGTRLDRSYSYEATGQGVDVIILDSGIRSSHAEFAAGRIEILTDKINDGLGGADCDGHGTHVAATIGGRVYGVSKGARLRVGRVLNCVGDGDWGSVIAVIDSLRRSYLGTPTTQRRPTVLSLSLGSGRIFPDADEAINNAVRAGIVVVVAAGNDEVDACSSSPGSADLAITVAASDQEDQRSKFSNYGPCIDLFAPGSGIVSAGHRADDAAVVKSGTSMAAPHVTGAAALFLERNPSATPAQVRAALVRAATETIGDARSGYAGLLHIVF